MKREQNRVAAQQTALGNGKIVEYQKTSYKNRELCDCWFYRRKKALKEEESKFRLKKVECKNYNFQRSTGEVTQIKRTVAENKEKKLLQSPGRVRNLFKKYADRL